MVLDKRCKDLTGLVFGSLTAVKPSHVTNNMVYWEFLCVCGKTHVARGNTVKHQAKKGDPELPSCGCIEMSRKTKHGFRTVSDTHPAYRVYRGMMTRCYNPNSPEYKWYGGKGVTVCEEWKSNPEAFVQWALDNGWKKGLHIDKDILCNKLNIQPHIYSPTTCQWVSAKTNVGFATNRNNFGKHPNIKLSHEEVAEIRRKYFAGEANGTELAQEFGLKSPSSIYRLIRLSKSKGQE